MCQQPTHEDRSVRFPLNEGKSPPPVKACEPSSVEIIITIHKAEPRASQTTSHRFYSARIQILLNSFVIWILHLFKYIKMSKVTKLLAYEIQTPFKWTKHGSLHFLWLVRPTLVCFISFPRRHYSQTITIRVPNTHEVRKWFDFDRSCRTCLKATKKVVVRNKENHNKKNT